MMRQQSCKGQEQDIPGREKNTSQCSEQGKKKKKMMSVQDCRARGTMTGGGEGK